MTFAVTVIVKLIPTFGNVPYCIELLLFSARRVKLPTEKIPGGYSTQTQNICEPYIFFIL